MNAYIVPIPKGIIELSDAKQMLARSLLYTAERIAITANTGAAASLRNCLRPLAEKVLVVSIDAVGIRLLNNNLFSLLMLFSKVLASQIANKFSDNYTYEVLGPVVNQPAGPSIMVLGCCFFTTEARSLDRTVGARESEV